MKSACLRGCGVCCAVLVAAGDAPAGLWEVIDSLTPGYSAEAVAVSADGSVIVGSSGTPSGQQAFRWTLGTGTVGLPRPTGLLSTWATGVSADGSYVAGYGGPTPWAPPTREGIEGLRWYLGDLEHPDRIAVPLSGVWAKGISADGTIVAGTVQGVDKDANEQAVRWTAGTGVVPLSHPLYPDPVRTQANGISANGQVVVGEIIGVGGPPVRDAFRWTESGGMVGLGAFTATAASRDGSVVVGAVDTDHGFEAYRWTQSDNKLVPLGTYAPNYTSMALGVSGDGLTVVGYIEDQSTDLRQAFIWKPDLGMRLLQDVLHERYGFDLSDWSLTKAYAISDDGRTIVGRAYHIPQGTEEAFRAILAPEPGTVALLAVAGLCSLAYAYRRVRRRKG